MLTLTSYKLNSVVNGDYNITMTFSDATTSTQTIHFGDLVDTPGLTALKQLDGLVSTYATAYQSGLASENTPASASLSNALGSTQTV